MNEPVDWHRDFLALYGPPSGGRPVDPAYARSFEGRLPDFLLRLWTEFGFGTYGEGRSRLCDPQYLAPVMETIFTGDPEIDWRDVLAIAHDPYGNIRAHHPAFGSLQIDSLTQFWVLYDELAKADRNPSSLDCDVGGALALPEDAIGDDGIELFPSALASHGPLWGDEIYGFFPSLRMGGAMLVENIRKVPMREHMLFVAQLGPFRLEEYFYRENDPDHPFGGSRFIRMIGPQS